MHNAPLWLLITLQAGVSAASLVVEIVAGRMMAPYVGMSLYTWTAIIAVVLAGFSAGHWWGGRVAERPASRAMLLTGWALLAAALTTAIAGGLLRLSAGPVLNALEHPVWGITVLCAVAFFAPSFFAGVPAPVLAQIAVNGTDRSGRALGAMFASGAIGAIAGTLLAGFVFISWLGSALTISVVAICYVLAALICFGLTRQLRGRGILAASGVALALSGSAALLSSPCDHESRYFCIRTEDISANPGSPVNLMVIDHLAHGISARDVPRIMFTDHAAMLDGIARMRMGDRPFSAFFVGGGTYSVPRAWTDRGIGPLTVAEIDPAVTRTAARDFWFDPDSATVLHEDARRALLIRPDRHYDVIVGDAFTDIAVPSHLVTQEFFQLVRDRLTSGGVFVMNVIDFQHRLEALAAIHSTLSRVFPNVEIWTEQRPPTPGERLVFVLVASDSASPEDSLLLSAPDTKRFGVLSDRFVQTVLSPKGASVLTDDYAPIDRLLGPG
ncbi:fused MFS/spermidine synthase [Roseovarius sp. PS-C2]|uniref:fused MFS/spermidine synthase n=1 Tax=Roseovarius sp. PS-C2 TaxID=2820814 RepID=UPI001C0CB81B|nr:fused MFS/spermidine synthase [Roseovarius sp. PS-C2]MBU3259726.1 fused MFS/spermidine synthase [Roseovarius sp. PS-C2]